MARHTVPVLLRMLAWSREARALASRVIRSLAKWCFEEAISLKGTGLVKMSFV